MAKAAGGRRQEKLASRDVRRHIVCRLLVLQGRDNDVHLDVIFWCGGVGGGIRVGGRVGDDRGRRRRRKSERSAVSGLKLREEVGDAAQQVGGSGGVRRRGRGRGGESLRVVSGGGVTDT